jgi:hypothetical protein
MISSQQSDLHEHNYKFLSWSENTKDNIFTKFPHWLNLQSSWKKWGTCVPHNGHNEISWGQFILKRPIMMEIVEQWFDELHRELRWKIFHGDDKNEK